MKYILIVALSLLCVNLSGCNAEGNDSDNSVLFETIASGAQSGVQSQTLQVIRSDAELNSLWNEHTVYLSPVPEKPVVDFSNEILIGAFLGETPTATCMNTLEVSSVETSETSVIVNITIKVPSTTVTCLVAEQPFEVIKLQRVENYIGFNVEVTEYDL